MAEATRPRVVDLGWRPDDHPSYDEGVSTIMLIGRLSDGQKKLLNAIAQTDGDELDGTEADAPVADEES